jgi:putative thiamine transport system permease protein
VSAHFKQLSAAPLLIFFALPLTASILFALSGMLDTSGWASLFAHPQLWPALRLSLITGFASTAVSVIVGLIIVAGLYQSPKLTALTGFMLAVPHLAIAISLSFLIMPSGFLARLISVFTKWQVPPNWVTTHDPYGLALVAALVLKETPFLIWIIASILNRDDIRQSLAGQRAAARSLGHGTTSIWLRIFLPQILPKMKWPLLVTFVYAATVIDMALVIGPTQPPTLATLVWADINDAQVLNNTRGFAGAWFLTLASAGVAGLTWAAAKVVHSRRAWLTTGPLSRHLICPRGAAPEQMKSLAMLSRTKFFALIWLYILLTFTLLLLSFAPLWPFPHLWPESISAAAWLRVIANPSALLTSLILAFATCCTGLVLILAWLESQPKSRDLLVILLSSAALGVPSILLSLGQYRAFLPIGFTGTTFGLFIAHLIPVTAYIFIVLVGPYRSFDPRWRASSSGLLASFPRFLWSIKLPLLKAPLLAASAVGFAVSFGQYIPAQLISAGRYSTLPMEAVTLTSGTNRPLTAAFTLLLMLPPLFAFITAAYFTKPRWPTA